MRAKVLIAVTIVIVAFLALTLWPHEGEGGDTRMASEMELKSVFKEGERIPVKYTCDGEDLSPPLEWNPPEGVKSYVLIMEDPDAPIGTFIHWVMYDIPGDLTSLPEGVPKKGETKYGKQGVNDFRQLGYGGPCPPPGKPHRYYFRLYALDTELDLEPGLSKRDVLSKIKGHVIAQAELMGIYGRG